jgi:hypothetical protein
VNKKIYTLIVATLAFGAAGALASRFVWPDVPIPLFCLVAAGLCLAPTVATLIWTSRTSNRQPEELLLLVLGGTAVRMVIVLGVGLLLYSTVPVFERMSFWIVVLVFYLVTLGLEIALLVSNRINSPHQREP